MKQLAEALRARLKEIEGEREHLLSLLAIYDGGSEVSANGSAHQPAPAVRQAQRRAEGRRNPFQAREGGPTQRIVAAVRSHPGMTYSEVIDAAVKGVVSEAGDPRRSVGSTLGALVKAGKIEKRDSRYYLPGT